MATVTVIASGERRGLLIMAGVALLIAVPGVLTESRVLATPRAAQGITASPSLDRFLTFVRAATPPTARVLVAGNPPALVFFRATYLLYPRTVYSALATDYAHGWFAPAVHWSDLQRRARRDGAGYVVTWGLPLAPHGSRRPGAGALVEVRS